MTILTEEERQALAKAMSVTPTTTTSTTPQTNPSISHHASV